jgi:hypothetical protein
LFVQLLRCTPLPASRSQALNVASYSRTYHYERHTTHLGLPQGRFGCIATAHHLSVSLAYQVDDYPSTTAFLQYFGLRHWHRQTYCDRALFFQGGGVRLKEQLANLGIPRCACRLSWTMVASCGEYPIRRFPALSDLTNLTRFFASERKGRKGSPPPSVNQADRPCQAVIYKLGLSRQSSFVEPINMCVRCYSFLSHVSPIFYPLSFTNHDKSTLWSYHSFNTCSHPMAPDVLFTST